MIRTNRDRLVVVSVQGVVAPHVRRQAFRIDADGVPFVLPGVGGITYNVRVGDSAFGWAGDHVEPGVSTAADYDKRGDEKNRAYNILACIGNKARVISGDAKGAEGVVTGHHGGIEHVLMDFDDEAIEKLAIDDKILIRACGQGLRLLDYPDVKMFNLDPDLLDLIHIEEVGGKLRVGVAAVVPAVFMGSGIGSADVASGDYDITTTDKGEIERLGIDKLRFGDIVALEDCDNLYGRSYRQGAVSIGVVVHSDCLIAGHGPGVATIMTTAKPMIEPVIDDKANIGHYLGIGRYRK
ncbi:MAG: DUF4438 domain-containing protein [Bacillota bacterium]|jgi:hypothetical protein|nr:DUF4438 domain-containing protein [Bacillota bacterium]HAN87147.1 DUF4438 domain-containing protein [Bacillota bacterium]